MIEIHTRRIRAITGNSTGSVKVTPTMGVRCHGVGLNIISGTQSASYDSVAEIAAALTEIRVKHGTSVKWRLNGTQLRDWLLFHGANQDMDLASTYGIQVYLPFAPDWLIASVADKLAYNPRLAVGELTIEIDASVNITVTAFERVSPDLDADSLGILTLEVIRPVAGGLDFYAEQELKKKGRLLLASVYKATGTGTYAVETASLLLGKDNVAAYDGITDDETADLSERAGFKPTAAGFSLTGRTADIFDMNFCRGDALAHGIDLKGWGTAKFRFQRAASEFVGVVPVLLERLEGYND